MAKLDGDQGIIFPDGTKLASGVQIGLRNLLINGNFNVNQRAYVSATATGGANQYTLDRWRVVISGQNLSFAASGNGNQVTAPAGGIEQVIEGANIGAAQHVINWVGSATCTVDGVAKAKGDSVTLTPGTNATVKFINGTVSQAQLERGFYATPFEFRPIGLELSLCRRYFRIGNYYAPPASVGVAAGYPIEMRVAPTITGGGSGFTVYTNTAETTSFNQTSAGWNLLSLSAEF